MTSIRRSMLLLAGLLAFSLASTVARAVDAGKSTNPSSAATGDHKVDAKNGEAAMKSTAPGYMSTGEIHGFTGNAAGGQSGKNPARP
jgi:hypothetical protein